MNGKSFFAFFLDRVLSRRAAHEASFMDRSREYLSVFLCVVFRESGRDLSLAEITNCEKCGNTRFHDLVFPAPLSSRIKTFIASL